MTVQSRLMCAAMIFTMSQGASVNAQEASGWIPDENFAVIHVFGRTEYYARYYGVAEATECLGAEPTDDGFQRFVDYAEERLGGLRVRYPEGWNDYLENARSAYEEGFEEAVGQMIVAGEACESAARSRMIADQPRLMALVVNTFDDVLIQNEIDISFP